MRDDFAELIPEGAVLLNVLRVVEYMLPDGEIYHQDLSYSSDGDDLAPGKAFEMLKWAEGFTLAPMIVEMVHDYYFGDGDDDEDVEVDA